LLIITGAIILLIITGARGGGGALKAKTKNKCISFPAKRAYNKIKN